MLKETISIFFFITLEGGFDSFNEFTAGAINRELQNLRTVCSIAAAKPIRFRGAISCVIMKLQTVQTFCVIHRDSGHMFEVDTARTATVPYTEGEEAPNQNTSIFIKLADAPDGYPDRDRCTIIDDKNCIVNDKKTNARIQFR